jgi:GT2 family glycosyltransferase
MKISAVVKCQLLDQALFTMTKEAMATIRPYVDELILIDHNSKVGQKWLRDTADIYINNKVPGGYPVTASQGMNVATGDVVALLNNDIKFFGDWATPLANLITDEVAIAHPYCIDWGKPSIPSEVKYYNPSPQQGMFFSAFMVNPKIYKKLGGWDTDYKFWGYDDWDFYYRVRKAGYTAILTSEVFYWHKGGATINKIGREKFEEKNRQLFIKKHGRDPQSIDWKYL